MPRPISATSAVVAALLALSAACSTYIEGSVDDGYEGPGIGVEDPEAGDNTEEEGEGRTDNAETDNTEDPEEVKLVEGDYLISFQVDHDDCGMPAAEPTMHRISLNGMQLNLEAEDTLIPCEILDPSYGEFWCAPVYSSGSTGLNATTIMTRVWIGEFSDESQLEGEILTEVRCEGEDCEFLELLSNIDYPCQSLELIAGEPIPSSED